MKRSRAKGIGVGRSRGAQAGKLAVKQASQMHIQGCWDELRIGASESTCTPCHQEIRPRLFARKRGEAQRGPYRAQG